MYRLAVRYGFMEDPNIPSALSPLELDGWKFNLAQTTFFLGRETLISTKKPGMAHWRENLFIVMSRNARSATAFFGLPPNRVVELGAQVEILKARDPPSPCGCGRTGLFRRGYSGNAPSSLRRNAGGFFL